MPTGMMQQRKMKGHKRTMAEAKKTTSSSSKDKDEAEQDAPEQEVGEGARGEVDPDGTMAFADDAESEPAYTDSYENRAQAAQEAQEAAEKSGGKSSKSDEKA